MKAGKKDPYDKTSTQRSSRMSASIKEAGGAAFTVRFKTAAELAELDALVAAGIGTSRNDVLVKLVAEKAKTHKGKTDALEDASKVAEANT